MWIPEKLRRSRWLSAARKLEWFPPYRAMGIKVLTLSDDWRRVAILLPLSRHNRNPGGGMFGGAVAALVDPIAALVCNRVFPGHQVWTRTLNLDFRREGRTDLELRFSLDKQQESAIRLELETRGRATPEFEFGLYSTDDRLCVLVNSRVAIRPLDYRPGNMI